MPLKTITAEESTSTQSGTSWNVLTTLPVCIALEVAILLGGVVTAEVMKPRMTVRIPYVKRLRRYRRNQA